MKELSIEEKAKRYDEALHKAKNYYRTTDSSSDIKLIGLIFPELKESEDERIRKWIIENIQETLDVDGFFEGQKTMAKKALAWLEKQGEKIDIANKEYWRGYREGKQEILDKYAELEKQGEQKPAWSEEDEKQARQIERIVHDDGCTQKLQKQIEDWLKSLKERVQPKQEWSEEDEYCRHQLIVFCENCMVKDDGAKRCAHWLKSLRPQNTWKPSDEQMKILNEVLNFAANHESPHWNDYIFGTLNNLIRQLKKL